MDTYHFDHPVKIVNLGDVHRASYNFDAELFEKNIQRIAEDDQTYWLSTGDLLEVATKDSKSSCYTATSPEEELNALSDELTPIAHKCLGFVASNHHDRIEKSVGISLDRALADRAKIKFLGVAATIKVTCGRCSYFISLHHGVGGGTPGNKVNRAIALSQNWLGADIYMTGHTHEWNHTPGLQTLIDRKRNLFVDIDTHHVITGHYLKYDGSYAEKYGLKKKSCGSVYVELGYNATGRQALKEVRVGFLGR